MKGPDLDVEIWGSALDPDSDERLVLVRRASSDSPLYRVFLYLRGTDLPFVHSVSYKLHATFKHPVLRANRSPDNPNCKVTIWTWGLFEVEASIVDKRGNVHTRFHQLRFDEEFDDPNVQFKKMRAN